MKKILFAIIITFIIIFIFFGIYYRNEQSLPTVKIDSEKAGSGSATGLLIDYKNFKGESVSLPDGWVLYKNKTLGFQFEYPGREFAYGVLKQDENKFTYDLSMGTGRKKFFYNISFSDGDSSRIMITMEESEVKSVDDWFEKEMAQYKISELGELYYKK